MAKPMATGLWKDMWHASNWENIDYPEVIADEASAIVGFWRHPSVELQMVC